MNAVLNLLKLVYSVKEVIQKDYIFDELFKDYK